MWIKDAYLGAEELWWGLVNILNIGSIFFINICCSLYATFDRENSNFSIISCFVKIQSKQSRRQPAITAWKVKTQNLTTISAVLMSSTEQWLRAIRSKLTPKAPVHRWSPITVHPPTESLFCAPTPSVSANIIYPQVYMNFCFWPLLGFAHFSNILPSWGPNCQMVVHFAHFQVQERKRGVLGGLGGVLCTYTS